MSRSPSFTQAQVRRAVKAAESALTRLRPGHPAGHHISLLIEQLKNYDRNPILLKPMIQMTMRRIEEARS